MKQKLKTSVRFIRRLLVWMLGGFLPNPLSKRSTLVAAGIAAFLLTAYPSNTPAITVGVILTIMVWATELILTVVSNSKSVSRHCTISIPYAFLLSIGVGSLYAAHSSNHELVFWISCILVPISVWLVSALPDSLNTKPLSAANFKNQPTTTQKPKLGVRSLLSTTWAGFGIIAICGLFDHTTTTWLALIVAIIITVITFWSALRALLYADRLRWRTLRELRRMSPKVVIPYGGTATYQAEMWYPYIDLLDENYYIVSLSEKTMLRLAENTSKPIVVPDSQTAQGVKRLVPNSVRIAYYPHNSKKNSLFREDRRYAHVFVHHGDGDKAPSFNPNSAKYDYLFVAGRGAIDRYERNGVDIPQSKFRIIGRPQTADIEFDDQPIAEKDRPFVLYAPTWYGKNSNENYSSLPIGKEIIRSLIKRDANVIFRPHPASRSRKQFRELIDEIYDILQEDSTNSSRQHIWGDLPENQWTVADVTNASDAMIADVSGIVTDYLQSGKPYSMATLRFDETEFREEFPTSRSAYVITTEEGSLSSALDGLLKEDPLAEFRHERRRYYLGGFSGDQATKNFIHESHAIIQANIR